MESAARFPVHNKPGTVEEKWSLRKFASVGRVHITVIAALGVFTFGWLFTGDYPWFLTGVCALDWFIVNLTNRIVDLKEDAASAITGTRFVARNRRLLLAMTFAVLVASLLAVHLLNPAITGLRIGGHLLGVFYNWPILPGRRRLKELYFWKNIASAAGFLITVFGYPLATAGWENAFHHFPPGISWATVVFSAVFFFLFEISYEVIYDLRDARGDAVAGIRTYPVVHGEKTAIHIVDGLIFSSMAALAIGYALAIVPWRIFIMIGAPVLQFIVYKRALPRGISAKDCIMITWMGAAMLLVYHLWVIAGLPGSRF
jgi:4-hydroxybenzoate polyprenyltransferase